MGSTFRFVHAADIHLDSPLRGLERYEGAPVEEIRAATRRALQNLVQLAIDEDAAFVLIAGDLYDGDWRDYNTGLFFSAQMARLREARIRVFVIAGNHDAASRLTRRLRPPDNVHVFATAAAESVPLDELGVVIHGQGFAQAAIREDLSLDYPTALAQHFNIGLLHTSLNGRAGHEPYAPCTLDGLRSRGYQYWALGHVHRREVVCEDPWVVFPGNLQGRHARETGPKGASLVVVEDGVVSRVTHHPLDVVRWADETLDVTGIEHPEQVIERAGAVMEAAIGAADGRLVALRLRVFGESPAHARLHADRDHYVNQLRVAATDHGADALWLEKVCFETTAPATGAAAVGDDLGGLLAGLPGFVDDEERMTRLREELQAFRAKLPAALLTAEDGFDPLAPETLAASVREAQALIRRRLLGGDPPT